MLRAVTFFRVVVMKSESGNGDSRPQQQYTRPDEAAAKPQEFLPLFFHTRFISLGTPCDSVRFKIQCNTVRSY